MTTHESASEGEDCWHQAHDGPKRLGKPVESAEVHIGQPGECQVAQLFLARCAKQAEKLAQRIKCIWEDKVNS